MLATYNAEATNKWCKRENQNFPLTYAQRKLVQPSRTMGLESRMPSHYPLIHIHNYTHTHICRSHTTLWPPSPPNSADAPMFSITDAIRLRGVRCSQTILTQLALFAEFGLCTLCTAFPRHHIR